jgi:hypothetical protein
MATPIFTHSGLEYRDRVMNHLETTVNMIATPGILADSPYEVDEDNSSSLLSQTCNEQVARFHSILSLPQATKSPTNDPGVRGGISS